MHCSRCMLTTIRQMLSNSDEKSNSYFLTAIETPTSCHSYALDNKRKRRVHTCIGFARDFQRASDTSLLSAPEYGRCLSRPMPKRVSTHVSTSVFRDSCDGAGRFFSLFSSVGRVVGIFKIFATPPVCKLYTRARARVTASGTGPRRRERDADRSEGYPCSGIKQIRDPQCGRGIMCVYTRTHAFHNARV